MVSVALLRVVVASLRMRLGRGRFMVLHARLGWLRRLWRLRWAYLRTRLRLRLRRTHFDYVGLRRPYLHRVRLRHRARRFDTRFGLTRHRDWHRVRLRLGASLRRRLVARTLLLRRRHRPTFLAWGARHA
ncbi:hypothetical protein RSP799_00520 [Ralstonia solanacearum]|nr:hypothetical protein RSP799_00520 [Ralstonia solanacearum]